MSTAIETAPRTTPPIVDHLPPFRVLLHNDDDNSQEDVTLALVELCSFPVEHALRVMSEADKTGVALVMITHKERAELLVEQFASKSIITTLEPAD